MSYRIAVATSDSLNVDLHFGSASQFEIYTVEGTEFSKTEIRTVPNVTTQEQTAENVGCETGCHSGCGSGCGERNGCSNGEQSETIEMLMDCRCVVCKKIGRNVLKQFERKAITVFDVELPIKEALTKITSYYHKVDERKLKYKNQ